MAQNQENPGLPQRMDRWWCQSASGMALLSQVLT
jgi:hypothetical protein